MPRLWRLDAKNHIAMPPHSTEAHRLHPYNPATPTHKNDITFFKVRDRNHFRV